MSAVPPWSAEPTSSFPPSARPYWLVALAVVLALGLLASGVYAGWAVAQRFAAVQAPVSRTPVPEYAKDALNAATSCSESIFSYDYRSFDDSVADGLTCATGDFREEYRKTTRDLRATAVDEEAVVRADVKQIGVIRAKPRRVKVMAYVNQFRRNKNLDGEKVDQNRVILTMVLTRGQWRVAETIAV